MQFTMDGPSGPMSVNVNAEKKTQHVVALEIGVGPFKKGGNILCEDALALAAMLMRAAGAAPEPM
jgi:hypothetical protein